jgi:hypothetical protein
MAMQLIIVATQVGADIDRLAEATGFAVEQIRPLEHRLREALIWNGKTVDAREWFHVSNDHDRMVVILAQAAVAQGIFKRELVDGGAAYADPHGKEVARFGIPNGARILSRFARPRQGFELSDLEDGRALA